MFGIPRRWITQNGKQTVQIQRKPRKIALSDFLIKIFMLICFKVIKLMRISYHRVENNFQKLDEKFPNN